MNKELVLVRSIDSTLGSLYKLHPNRFYKEQISFWTELKLSSQEARRQSFGGWPSLPSIQFYVLYKMSIVIVDIL